VSYYLAPMRIEDIPEVSRVERLCFTNPWPQSAYRRELRNSANNYYVVLWHRPEGMTEPARPPQRQERGPLSILPFVRRSDNGQTDTIAGFAGMWVLYDEAHITTIGIAPNHRGKGLGELLLIDLFDKAIQRNAEWVTLEVRVSNDSAQALYEKYGFTRQGVRRRYYSDNGEDAYIMWSPSLNSPEYAAQFEHLRATLLARLDGLVIDPPIEALHSEETTESEAVQ
jgi:[ribosomal protein S18]-alanine N-acetyltransferase